MTEFNDRIAAQRQILRAVNRQKWGEEELFGLSSKAIERWSAVNRIDPNSRLVTLVKAASSQLFFLANKSQEQISDEYQMTKGEVTRISEAIELEVR